ncbi:MAG: 2-oxoglutarate dehydrogenase E1 component [Chloroflexota bacterium]
MTIQLWEKFYGPNAGYVLELYDRYRKDPNSVDAQTRAFFEQWTPPSETLPSGNGHTPTASAATTSFAMIEKVVAATNYAQAIRDYGHVAAHLDPLGTEPPGDPALLPKTHGVSETDLSQLPANIIGGPLAKSGANALETTRLLRQVYASSIGYDYDHIRIPEERAWLREAAEAGTFRPPSDPIDPVALLKRLTQVEVFEQFLHRIFPGKHRFSIEGVDIMIPIMDDIVGAAAESGIHTILIGMAHRGRLNVLAHILNKPYIQILAEFKDPGKVHKFRDDLGWTGDVKYHMGARRAMMDGTSTDLVISIAPNPSHLEFVNPVVEGMTRAVGTRTDHPGAAQFDPTRALPLVIHGDAAFPGQGIVAETLNLSRLPGYWTGGTVHIIANNQLGYTTLAQDGRSTLYASDLAKGFKIPVVHVNADDPEACIEVARLAFAYRAKFQKDFLIDLIGYRRYGHNEGDEPTFTQPMMYQKVHSTPTVRKRWADTLIERGIITADQADGMVRERMDDLQHIFESLNPEKDLNQREPVPPPPGTARRAKSAVTMKRLRELNEGLLTIPAGFNFHPKLEKARQRRHEMLNNPDEPSIDWATAEELAFATILSDGIAIRMTGQDVERGTFNQRHAVFHDTETGETFTPLQALPQAKAAFEIHNSPLSENAALGFEYGYNVQEPGRLVLWEAQYGDFDNGAQVIIDEFITSARAKWGQTPSLVLLLPHGFEGAGPDHSSARLERFLELAGEINMRVANCTTAAQFFHLLRRQAALLESDPLPLIVMTPKSLLRNRLINSPLRDFAEGSWRPVIDDARVENPDKVRRLILCSGKIYIDLIANSLREEASTVAIVRIEQIYPFPAADLKPILDRYPKAEMVVWVQEEPENMGAWDFVRPLLNELIHERYPLHYVGRTRSSSPAEGSSAWHTLNQETLIKQAYHREVGDVKEGFIREK